MANILLENAAAWGKMKKGLVSDIKSASRRAITETVLENARRAVLQEHASLGATSASNVAITNKVMMPLIKRVMPTVIANEIMGVVPMSGPVAQITTMRVQYAETVPANGAGVVAGTEGVVTTGCETPPDM